MSTGYRYEAGVGYTAHNVASEESHAEWVNGMSGYGDCGIEPIPFDAHWPVGEVSAPAKSLDALAENITYNDFKNTIYSSAAAATIKVGQTPGSENRWGKESYNSLPAIGRGDWADDLPDPSEERHTEIGHVHSSVIAQVPISQGGVGLRWGKDDWEKLPDWARGDWVDDVTIEEMHEIQMNERGPRAVTYPSVPMSNKNENDMHELKKQLYQGGLGFGASNMPTIGGLDGFKHREGIETPSTMDEGIESS